MYSLLNVSDINSILAKMSVVYIATTDILLIPEANKIFGFKHFKAKINMIAFVYPVRKTLSQKLKYL